VEGKRGILQEWYRSPVTVTFEAKDDMVGMGKMWYKLNEASNFTRIIEIAYATWPPITITQESVNELSYYAEDKYQNKESPHTTPINIDLTPPTVTLPVTPTGEYSGCINLPYLIGDVIAGLDNYTLKLDGEVIENEALDYASLALGLHTITVAATDLAGWIVLTRYSFDLVATSPEPLCANHQIITETVELPECRLYAVHDRTSANSQLFTVGFTGLEEVIAPFGPEYPSDDIDALDLDPATKQLFVVKSYLGQQASELYRVDPITASLTFIGPIKDADGDDFRDVDALSFHPDGTLWGFARQGDPTRRGLLQINAETGRATLVERTALDAEGLAWTPDGSVLWLSNQKKLYTTTVGGVITSATTVTALPGHIAGLEFRPDGLLLAGMHHGGGFNVYALDVSRDPATIVLTDSLTTDAYNDAESLAWPAWCPTALPVPSAISPTVAATLVYTASDGVPLTIFVPAGAVEEPLTLALTALDLREEFNGSAPQFGNRAFRLNAYRNGVKLPAFTFQRPVTVTIAYEDGDVLDLDESTLMLYSWSRRGGRWGNAACGPYQRNPGENRLAVPICHLTEFALLAGRYPLYLPLVLK
jgi:hypothetical protein